MGSAFKLERQDNGIARLTFDLPDSKVNTLSTATMQELAGVVNELACDPEVRGLLFLSGKEGQFIAGADLRELAGLAVVPKEQAAKVLDFGQQLFQAISQLPFPTVGLVSGAAMGGGTELALALDYRIAAANGKTSFALPEVKLGILPGWGGTQRLPRVVGIPHAIQYVCSGDTIDAKKAAELGLVFDVVPAESLVSEGERLLERVIASGEWKQRRECLSAPAAMEPDAAAMTFAVAEGMLIEKTKGQYAAPLLALKAIQRGAEQPMPAALAAEREACLEVVGSPQSANLIGIFFATKRLERDSGVDDASIVPQDVVRMGVVGAGLMGSGIATAAARRGIPTMMVDTEEAFLAKGLARAQEVVASRMKIGRATLAQMGQMLALLSTATQNEALAGVDLVVEAVTEKKKVKEELYHALDGVVGPKTIVASNTSTLSITQLAKSISNQERFIGMHFFNPVDRMQLVEVIRGEKTSDQTVASVVQLAKKLGKTPIVVKDCPGFVVNRILFPYLAEGVRLLEEGVPMDLIDRAATEFGMPMGPILLQDVVGLDTSLYAGTVLQSAYSDRAILSPILTELVAEGRLGQKSGRGFRLYDDKKKSGRADPQVETMLSQMRTATEAPIGIPAITERLILPMFLEATRVLEEKIVREPSDIDMALVLGIGFPPFRGGILRWCDSVGAPSVLELTEQYGKLGKRMQATGLLKMMASEGKTFYPLPKL